MKKVLVTGGSGYIGSHTVVELLRERYDVSAIDNFSRSHSWIGERITEVVGRKVRIDELELKNKSAVLKYIKETGPYHGIIHFAAYKTVPESVKEPLKYFENNLNSLLNLLHAVEECGIPNFVFSSSCAVYGNPQKLPVTEETPMGIAESPYARTKQMGEDILRDFSRNSPCNISLLRYFNPVGSHESGLLGDLPIGVPDNLVPYITQTAIGTRDELTVFGDDYDTRDGSCVRDYIHVVDIANAHVKAMEHLDYSKEKGFVEVFNLGSGNGVSVLEVIKAFEKSTGLKLNYKIGPRRPGDVESIYADNSKARTELNWLPGRSIEEMMNSAWKWEKNLKNKNWL